MGAERPFQLRVGINTGFCTVGNFGGEDRMDYTIIGNVVNMTARLQTQAEVDSILIGHETYSLVKSVVATEEQPPIKVKGFAEPLHCYKVLGLYDDLPQEGQLIREEDEGFEFVLDLNKNSKQMAISKLEAILARLRG
jgi:adenylate cyclase